MGAAKKLPLISPFLASAAIPRTGESKLPGYYSKEKDMWVVETESGVKPCPGLIPVDTSIGDDPPQREPC